MACPEAADGPRCNPHMSWIPTAQSPRRRRRPPIDPRRRSRPGPGAGRRRSSARARPGERYRATCPAFASTCRPPAARGSRGARAIPAVPRLPAPPAQVGLRQALERRGHAPQLGQARPHVPQPRPPRILPQPRTLAPLLNRPTRLGGQTCRALFVERSGVLCSRVRAEHRGREGSSKKTGKLCSLSGVGAVPWSAASAHGTGTPTAFVRHQSTGRDRG